MRPGAASILRGAVAAIVFLAWTVLAYLGAAGLAPADLAVALAVLPVAVLAVIALWRTGSLLLPVIGAAVSAALLVWAWPALRENVTLLYFVQHAGINLALAVIFGRTLAGGREALVARFARLAHGGAISAAKARYCRQVTLAWSVFFLVMTVLSAGLFILAPAAAWSFFANLLPLPLLLAMFVAEQLVRNRVLPPEERSNFSATLRGYRASQREQRAARLADQP